MSASGTPKGSVMSMSPGVTPKNNVNSAYNEQFFYENQLLSFQSSSQVSRIMDHLITCGANVLYDKYLLERSPFYEAEDLCRWTYTMFVQDYIDHDKGETEDSYKNQLTQEMEPPNQRLDSRSCLSAKTEYKMIYPEVEKDDMSETRSNYSRVSGMSRLSKVSAVRKMKKVITASTLLGQSFANLSRTSMQNIEKQASIEDVQPTQPKIEEPQVVYVGDDSEKEKKKKEEQDDPVSDKLRDLREKKDKERQIDMARKQKMMQEEQEIDERKKEQERQLKNKDFTQDYDGTVIFLNKNRLETPSNANDLIVLDYKNKQQADIVKPAPLDTEIVSSPVKLMNEFTKKKKENLSAAFLQEFHKQPPLHEVLNPNEGVKVQFQTGQKKQGSEFKNKETQMTKKQYNTLISDQPNRPIPKYIQNIRQAKVDINDKANQIIELSEHSSTQSNKQKRQIKPQSAGMHVMNRDALLMMLQEAPPFMRPTSSQLIPMTVSMKSIQSAQNIKKPEETKPQIGNSIQDKIKVYDKKSMLRESHIIYPHMSELEINEDFQDLGINMKNLQKKPQQNLNVIVEKFNKKIMDDPTWGVSKIDSNLDILDKPLGHQLKMPTISRVQSAKNHTRPDSAISKFTVKSSMINQSFRPTSGRPTTANTNSRISQNRNSFFGVKQI